MWIFYAFCSAFFAGVTSVLAKCGIKKTDSSVATAIRTIVVFIFSWIMVFLVHTQSQISQISSKNLLFLILSGLATGASWLCYFKALQIGDINKVVVVDKSSTVLTILLAFLLLGESISIPKLFAVAAIGIGTYLMIERKQSDHAIRQKSWFFYAALSALFASLTTILGKVGISDIDSNLGTAIRTSVVLILAWVVIFVSKKEHTIKQISKRELSFICLSGIATGASWLCYYKALQDGLASVVAPIDKLSIVVTVVFSYVVFKERLSKKALIGFFLVVAGTFLMLF